MSGRASVCLLGGQLALGSTEGLPGRPSAGKPPVPTWVAPRQRGVNLLSVGKASRTLLPARVCSGPDSSHTETSRAPGFACPRGILPGFTFYGEVLEGWAERSRESGQGLRRGAGSQPPPSPESLPPRPAPPPRLRWGVGGQARWDGFTPGPGPPHL